MMPTDSAVEGDVPGSAAPSALRRRQSADQRTLVAPTMTKDRAMRTTASAREVCVSDSRSR